MLKYRLEGYSDASMEDALAQAMAKAAASASEDHDMHVAVLELSVLPGRGFKAVVEVTIIPITFRETLHREAQDVELKRIGEEDYRARKSAGEVRVKKAVEDHFLRTMGTAPYIPDVFLAHLDDAQIKNNLIEKQFYNMFLDPVTWQPITDATVLAALNTVLAPQTHHHIQYEGASDHPLTIDNPALEDKVEKEFDHAVHPEHVVPQPGKTAPAAAPASTGVRPKRPGLSEDDDV